MSMVEKAKFKARERAASLKKMAAESGLLETKAVWEMTPEERKAHELKLAGKDPASLAKASRPEPTFEQKEELDKRMRRVKTAVNAYFEADTNALAAEKVVATERARTDTTTQATTFFTTVDGQKLMKMLIDDELRIMGTGGTASQRMTKAKEQALENYISRKTREAVEDIVEQYKVKTDKQHAAHMALRDEIIDALEEEATVVASWGWVEMVDEETQSIIITETTADGINVQRVTFSEVEKIEYVIGGQTATFEVFAITDDDRILIQSSDDTPIRGHADHISAVIEKPIEEVRTFRTFGD